MAELTNVGSPKYVYEIGYSEREWHLVLTSKNRHFYFNSRLGKSYWQIQDIEEVEDKEEFAKCIDYDHIGLLTAKVNGLRGLEDGYYFKKGEENEVLDQHSDIENEGYDEEEQERASGDSDANEQLVKEFLEDEGFLATEEKDPEQKEAQLGLQLGYSSSEEEDEEEQEEGLKGAVSQVTEAANNEDEESVVYRGSGDPTKESDSENINEGLDLALSEDEVNEGLDLEVEEVEKTLENTKKEFKGLLDAYKDQISIYDPWFLVEEELMKQFVQRSEYYAISDSGEKERIFDEWVALQKEEKVEDDGEETAPLDEGPFPSDIQLYYQFLQLHKSDIKKMFYKEFLVVKGLEMEDYLAEHSLDEGVFQSPKAREHHYRIFKITLDDFAVYERGARKAKSVPAGVNLKRRKIDEYLALQTAPGEVDEESMLKIASLEEDFFTKWTRLCNKAEVSSAIAESPVNYIVGDEKRFEAYLEWVKKR